MVIRDLKKLEGKTENIYLLHSSILCKKIDGAVLCIILLYIPAFQNLHIQITATLRFQF
jgi:hypothetical protein